MPDDLVQHVTYKRGDRVRSGRFGLGNVEVDNQATLIVRFTHGLEECLRDTVIPVRSAEQLLGSGLFQSPLDVVTKAQALCILSANDAWGVFARSQIDLLPHQLWVCRRVCERFPFRWLVADDVGLGKTIEAGLILTPLLSRQLVRRILIICPASLVDQWQDRMRKMFDIRMATYAPEVDRPRSDFWNTQSRVIASMQTLRDDRADRHKRLLEAEPWDLLIVDEAHHLNADEKMGPTLAYQLVAKLAENNRVSSMVFFTGTPHRGKNFGFFSLLRLLRADLFDPSAAVADQLPKLREVMIRNNKQSVTDLEGKRLFQQPSVTTATYRYSPAESHFYEMLTEFISTGKAYAGKLGGFNGRAVMLVLISMQKLASSSVAAIRRAIRGRLDRLSAASRGLEAIEKLNAEWQAAVASADAAATEADEDIENRLEEQIAVGPSQLQLMADEQAKLEELVGAADAVLEETKIHSIVEFLKSLEPDRSVLFFTEYKATQSLLMSAIIRVFGDDCVTFINGDGRAEGVVGRDGREKAFSTPRAIAADRFNAGEVRFMVSTEAGGEGIDLQQRCHTLVHVDLPWNPMRLHQRVGRLNRYGQRHKVEVTLFRNPDTVEARIWDKLNEKIAQINAALGSAMDEPEDLLELVLGMTSPSVFRELFAQGSQVKQESFASWFDAQTARFGGKDAVDVVKELVGNCARFDFHQVSALIPRVTLSDLRPFFLNSLAANQRKPKEDNGDLSFKTPRAWCVEPAILPSYEGLHFERGRRGREAAESLLGVGHRLFNHALTQAEGADVTLAWVSPHLVPDPLFVYRVQDRVTGQRSTVRTHVFAVRLKPNGDTEVLNDWQLLVQMNVGTPGQWAHSWTGGPSAAASSEGLERATTARDRYLKQLKDQYQLPVAELIVVLWPGLAQQNVGAEDQSFNRTDAR